MLRILLADNNLGDIDSVFRRATSVDYRHQGRGVWSTWLRDAGGGQGRVFIKMQWGLRRLLPRLTDLKTGQTFQCLPQREWHGLARFERLGLNVPQRLACFGEGSIHFRAAVVVRAVPPEHSIDDLLRRNLWHQFPAESRAAILDTVVTTVRSIHDSGLDWRSISGKHFFPQQADDGTWKLWLIDCEGVHTRVTQKSRSRGYAKLLRSMRQSGADADTLRQLETRVERALATPTKRAA